MTTATTSPRAIPGRFVACFLYTVRVCVPPRRWALLTIPVVASGLLGLLAHALDDPTPEGAFNSVSLSLFLLVLPFACLVVGDAVLGAEVRSGAFALTWLSPTPFVTITTARWLAGWVIASVTLAPSMALAAAVAGVPDAIGPLVLSVVAGAAAYIGLFVLIGATVRRGALWSLGVVFLGEHLLGAALAGVAQLSPLWLTQNAYAGLGPDADEIERSGVPSGTAALVRLGVITLVTLAVAVSRVRKLKLAGASD